MVEQIKKRVAQELNNRHKEIVVGAYQYMIQSHNDFCGCEYCVLLKQYISKKKQLARTKQAIESSEFDYCNRGVVYDAYGTLNLLNKQLAEIKAQKDKLKQL